jgi:hypothetical protein
MAYKNIDLNNFMKNGAPHFIATLIFVIVCIWLASHFFIINDPKSREIKAELEKESGFIAPMPFSVIKEHKASSKPGQALVTNTYSIRASYENIKSFYDAQLLARGWQFSSERKIKDWGRDLGGVERIYCKNGLSANLQYAGEQTNYGWTFGIAFSWGIQKECK